MNLFASLMRTAVPLLAGWLITVAGALGIDADSTAVAGGVTVAISAVYYLLFRLIEEAAGSLGNEVTRKVAGVLLGYARPPEYSKPASAPPPPAPPRPETRHSQI